MQDIMQGRTVAGRRFYFGWRGLNGILLTDEPNPELARIRIELTLKLAGQNLGPGSDPSRQIR